MQPRASPQQLLSVSRNKAVQTKHVELNRLIADTTAVMRRLVGEEVSLDVSLLDAPLFVCADDGQLQQVLMNLVINAKDAMPEGGRLSISTAREYIERSHFSISTNLAQGEYVVLSVADYGHGMDDAVKQRLFEPFFTTKEEGSGLGLSVVYGIVEEHKGAIVVDSEPGKGSTFRVFFPLSVAGGADVEATGFETNGYLKTNSAH